MVDDANTLKSLHHKRGVIHRAITNFMKIVDSWVNDPDSRDPDYLQTALETMELNFSKFYDTQEKIEAIDESELDKRDTYETFYNKAKSQAKKLLREFNVTNNPTSLPPSTFEAPLPQIVTQPSNEFSVKIPTVSLPSFSGSVEEWPTFIDNFTRVIHDEPRLPAVRKFQYLKLSLKGSAAATIDSLKITEENYSLALNTLTQKYECPRKIMRKHWAMLRDYPKLVKDTPAALSKFLTTLNLHLQALKNMEAPIDHWDLPLIELILSKISTTTAWHWELSLTDKSMPPYTHLIDFLEKRANCTDFNPSDQPKVTNSRHDNSRNRKSDFSTNQAFVTSNSSTNSLNKPSNCIICSQEHPIYRCATFRELSVEERQKRATNLSLCFNCLGQKHGMRQCLSKSTCRECNARHHTLLHQPQASSSMLNKEMTTSKNPSEMQQSSKA